MAGPAIEPAAAAPASSEGWRRSTTLPELFRGALADWPNNSYLGLRHKRADGSQGSWYEWESYREVELSITAIARSLRIMLKGAGGPGLRVAIMGPPSSEAVKIWQACCHLSAVPVFVPCDGSISSTQLHHLLVACGITALFIHQEHQHALAAALDAVTSGASSAGSAAAAADGSAAASTPAEAPSAAAAAAAAVPQLVVVWGAGGIRYTQPSPALVQTLTRVGVATVQGYEDFKRSHFNDESNPGAAFAELIMPGPGDTAALLVTDSQACQPDCQDPEGLQDLTGDSHCQAGTGLATQVACDVLQAPTAAAGCGGGHMQAAAAQLKRVGLVLHGVSHCQLVGAAAQLLRRKFPGLEEQMEPYVAGVSDDSTWTGRPHTPTCCIASLASVPELTRLAATTAAAGMVVFAEQGMQGLGDAVCGEGVLTCDL